jgi:hypothetical protein
MNNLFCLDMIFLGYNDYNTMTLETLVLDYIQSFYD